MFRMGIITAVPGLDGDRAESRLTDRDVDVEGPLSADELFYVLENPRRRAVIRYLRWREGPVEMRDVAEHVAAQEADTTVTQLPTDKRKSVYISLYQQHLEILADAGLIEYDKSRGTIVPQPRLEDVAVYLEQGPPEPSEPDIVSGPWALGYLGISVAAMLLLLGSILDLPVVEPLSELAIMGLVLLLFTALTVARVCLNNRSWRKSWGA